MCARGKRSDFQSDSKKEMNVATRKASGATHIKNGYYTECAWIANVMNVPHCMQSQSDQIHQFMSKRTSALFLH